MSSIDTNNETYYRITGLAPVEELGPEPFNLGKLWWRAVQGMGAANAIRLLTQGRVAEAYFVNDKYRENHLQYSEKLAYTLNQMLLSESLSSELKNRIELSLHHGYNHFRRVEKYKKAIDAHDVELRSNADYLYFAISGYVAIYFHDLVEVYTREKRHHDSGSAILTLGYMLQKRDQIAAAMGSDTIPDEVSQKLSWAAAFICLYHSKPEEVAEVDDLLKNGLFDAKQILKNIEETARLHGQNIYTFFPPFKLIENVINDIKANKLTIPTFSKNELEGLIKMLRAIAASDKLDATYPVGLAATRMILTVPDRPWYIRLEGDNTLEEELEVRKQGAAGSNASCDFDRILYEITRAKAFTGLSPWVSFLYSHGLTERAKYFTKVIPAFLDGNIESYLEAYPDLLQTELKAIMMKIKIPQDRINATLLLDEHGTKIKDARKLAINGGYAEELITDLVQGIDDERLQVRLVLTNKSDQLSNLRLSIDEKRRIIDLLNLAIKQQRQSLFQYPGLMKIKLPYEGYYWVDLVRYKLN